jgi:hypothetical protein
MPRLFASDDVFILKKIKMSQYKINFFIKYKSKTLRTYDVYTVINIEIRTLR